LWAEKSAEGEYNLIQLPNQSANLLFTKTHQIAFARVSSRTKLDFSNVRKQHAAMLTTEQSYRNILKILNIYSQPRLFQLLEDFRHIDLPFCKAININLKG